MARFTEALRQVLVRYSKPGAVDLTQQEIAEEMDRNRATVHAHCSRLVDLGFLERIDHGRYTITDKGRTALDRRSAASSANRVIRCPDCGRKLLL